MHIQLEIGNLTAHKKIHLMLLGSPPDMVHGISLRQTNLSTLHMRVNTTQTSPGVGIHPCCSGMQAEGPANSPTSATLL